MAGLAEIVFNPGANSFKITADSRLAQTWVTLTISGPGITNNSGVTQNLVAGPTVIGVGGTIEFLNAATAIKSLRLRLSWASSLVRCSARNPAGFTGVVPA
jgi:hypothetical protein